MRIIAKVALGAALLAPLATLTPTPAKAYYYTYVYRRPAVVFYAQPRYYAPTYYYSRPVVYVPRHHYFYHYGW